MNLIPLLPPRTNVLFVGDNVGKLKAIAFELQRAGCSILWDIKGVNGIRTAGIEVPDLIICETDLAEISAFDLCQRVRADSRSRHIPIILVGESEAQEAKLNAFEAGADEYFLLPRDTDRLLARVFWLVEGGYSKPLIGGYYNKLRSQQTHLSRIVTETADLLKGLGFDREDRSVGLGRGRAPEKETSIYDRIDLGMHLIGVAADLFEEEVRELDLTEAETVEAISLSR
ncbi:MAG: response regulator [Acidobacteriota bacterium]